MFNPVPGDIFKYVFSDVKHSINYAVNILLTLDVKALIACVYWGLLGGALAINKSSNLFRQPFLGWRLSWLPHGLNGCPKLHYVMFHLTLVAEYSKFSWRFLRQIKQVQLKVTGGD